MGQRLAVMRGGSGLLIYNYREALQRQSRLDKVRFCSADHGARQADNFLLYYLDTTNKQQVNLVVLVVGEQMLPAEQIQAFFAEGITTLMLVTTQRQRWRQFWEEYLDWRTDMVSNLTPMAASQPKATPNAPVS
jgi:hypothetical protein